MEPEPLHWAVGVFATGPPGKSPQPFYFTHSFKALDFPGDSDGKEFACITGDPGLIPGLGRSPGKGTATHSSIFAWEIPQTEEPGGL